MRNGGVIKELAQLESNCIGRGAAVYRSSTFLASQCHLIVFALHPTSRSGDTWAMMMMNSKVAPLTQGHNTSHFHDTLLV